MTSPEDLPLRNGEDSGNTDDSVARRELGQKTLKGDSYSANMKRLDDLNKDLAEFNKAKKFEDYMKSIHEAQVAGDDALLDKLITQHEAELQAEYEKAQEEKRAREQAYEQMSDEEKRQNYEQELAQSQAEYDANHPEGAENGDPAGAEAGENEPVTVEETVKKHHMSKAAKRALVVGIATALATVGTIVVANIISGGSKSSGGDSPSAPEPTPTTVTAPEAPKIPVAEKHESIAKLSTYKGQFASEDGKDFNKNKNSNVSFGEALRSGLTEDEMKEELGGRMTQPAQLAATYYYMQEKTSNPNFGVEGAKFNSSNELTDAMKNGPKLHQKVYDFITSTINDNKLSEDAVSGNFNNYFMTSEFETGDIDTSRVEIVGCTTKENGTKVYKLEYVWADEEGIHTDIFTFKERCGGQPLDEEDFTTTVRHIPEKETTSNPTDDTTNKKDNDKKDDDKKDKPTEGDDKKEDKPTEDNDKGGETPTTSPTPEYPIITTPSEPPVTVLASKNEKNLNRIAADTEKSHEEDLHVVDYTPFQDTDVTKVEEITKEPTAENYEGTSPAVARNEKAEGSEPVGRDHLWVSIPENETPPSPVGEKNDYGNDLGGANDQNARENPVESNQESQNQADQNRIPDNELPGAGEQGTRDLLAELGIF